MQSSFHSVGVVLTLVQTKQIRINIHKRNNTNTQYIQFFANDQLDALSHIFIYYTSLHVSSIIVLTNRRSNCIITSSGMTSLCE